MASSKKIQFNQLQAKQPQLAKPVPFTPPMAQPEERLHPLNIRGDSRQKRFQKETPSGQFLPIQDVENAAKWEEHFNSAEVQVPLLMLGGLVQGLPLNRRPQMGQMPRMPQNKGQLTGVNVKQPISEDPFPMGPSLSQKKAFQQRINQINHEIKLRDADPNYTVNRMSDKQIELELQSRLPMTDPGPPIQTPEVIPGRLNAKATTSVSGARLRKQAAGGKK